MTECKISVVLLQITCFRGDQITLVDEEGINKVLEAGRQAESSLSASPFLKILPKQIDFLFYCYWMCNFQINPHVCLLDGLTVGWSVFIINLQRAEKLNFHAPTGAFIMCSVSANFCLELKEPSVRVVFIFLKFTAHSLILLFS